MRLGVRNFEPIPEENLRFPIGNQLVLFYLRLPFTGGPFAETFRNRKGVFSLNIQTVSGPDLRIYDIVARYPGSTHDSFIFNNSKLKERFERGEFRSNVLLGDGGYGLKTYVMTPIKNPSTRAEKLYNESHIKTRNTVERQYGVLKRRFPCLSYGMRLKLETQAVIIIACAVIHNYCILKRDEFVDRISEPRAFYPEILFDEITSENPRIAKRKQYKFIEYFNNLMDN